MNRKFSAWMGAMSLSVALCTSAAHSAEQLDTVDRALPEFNLESVENGQWQTADLQGKPWVINFWATWCPPCVEEMPSMNAAWETLESQGVGMLAINAGEGQEAVEAFLKRIPIDFPILLGNTDTLADWSVMALPTTIIVNAQGEVVREALGPREWDDAALLERVLQLRIQSDGTASAVTPD